MIDFILFISGFLAWLVSTVAAGGGALVLIPVVSFFLGAQSVAPVVTLGTFIAAPTRAWLFKEHIHWLVLAWQIPGSIAGALFGAYIFTQTSPQWLQFAIGLFLVSTVFQFRFGRKVRSFPMMRWAFLPVSFCVAMISALVGAVGPVLNPFYLNYGIVKEQMIATKAFNSLFMQMTKIIAYASFGAFTTANIWYGVLIGISAILGSWYGKHCLKKMTAELFRKGVVTVMVISGVVLIVQAF